MSNILTALVTLLFSVTDFLKTYIIVIILLYFIPSFIGAKTKGAIGIFVLNLLLGWTVVGWLGALIWALSAVTNLKSERQHNKLMNVFQKMKVGDMDSHLSLRDGNEDQINSYNQKRLLFSELSRLHDLREKKVIDEHLYNKEKAEILSKIQKCSPNEVLNQESSPNLMTSDVDTNYQLLFPDKSPLSKKGIVFGLLVLFTAIICVFYFLDSFHMAKDQTIIGSSSPNNYKLFTGLWQSVKEDGETSGLRIEQEGDTTKATWILFMDCALDFSPTYKNDTLFLSGDEFEGGNSFSNFFV